MPTEIFLISEILLGISPKTKHTNYLGNLTWIASGIPQWNYSENVS